MTLNRDERWWTKILPSLHDVIQREEISTVELGEMGAPTDRRAVVFLEASPAERVELAASERPVVAS
jgi:hypothetical protein